MNIFQILKYVSSRPLNKHNKARAILRYFKWQVGIKLNPYPIIYPFTEKAKLVIQKGMTGATGNLYAGLHEFSDMSFVLHFLRENDLFLDIGANIGSYTVLGSAHVGARTISMEPIPSTFSHLKKNVVINSIEDKVKIYNTAVGSKKDVLKMTSSLDTMNHVAKEGADTVDVPVETLDFIVAQQNDDPVLLKIDVEGFEAEVIAGASETLKNKTLKAIIIEFNGFGSRYGYDEQKVHDKLIGNLFKPYKYDPFTREITLVESFGTDNTIYIRDEVFTKERLKNASKFKVLNTFV